jgi:two-component system KDP operon response regulator KdpE
MASEQPTVLVVDDSPQIRRLLKTSLTASRYHVVEAENAASALACLKDREIDLVILDIGLPDRSGFSVLEEIRTTSHVPTIMLSVEEAEDEKVAALELGADDYVTKPFGMGELIARMKVALRHRLQVSGTTAVLHFGDIEIDLVNRRVQRSGEYVRLSPTEYNILRLLAEHAGKTLTHDYLIQRIWGNGKANSLQYLRVYVRSLRQKLGDVVGGEKLIHTESGVGYRLRSQK